MQPRCDIHLGFSGRSDLDTKGSTKCLVHSITESESCRSTWVFPNYGNIDYFDPSRLFHTLEKIGINKILFAGDSITQQIYSFLICDMFRLKNITFSVENEFFANVTVNGVTISLERIKSHLTEAIGRKEQINLVVNDLHRCIDKLFLDILLKGSVSGRTLLLFNQGLHIQSTSNTDKIIHYFSLKLIQLAKSNVSRFYVMFRETAAQHYSQLPGGEFDIQTVHTVKYSPTDFCCDKNHSSASVQNSNWRNRKFLHYLSQIDSSWNNYIAWLPFYNLSHHLYDIHIGLNHHFDVDCSHFAYYPFILAPLWYDIEDKFNRLIDARPRNIST